MTHPEDQGTMRTARVLSPAFTEGLASLPLDEVRRRRDEALAEREFQSYLRRLVQVRMDVLRAEQERRARGEDAGDFVAEVTAILAEGPQGRGRGEALRLAPAEEDIVEAEERADLAMGPALGASPDALDDEALAAAVDRLASEERRVSRDRAAVIQVHDVLQTELKRRYREDPSQIPVQL